MTSTELAISSGLSVMRLVWGVGSMSHKSHKTVFINDLKTIYLIQHHSLLESREG